MALWWAARHEPPSFMYARRTRMHVFNTTPYVFSPHDASLAPTLPALTLIVRGTFALPAGGPASARPRDQQPPPRGDEQHLDDLGRSLAYSTDLVPSKPRGEVLVYGTCHTPEHRPIPTHDVAIQVGPIQKTLRVTGPRLFVEGVGGRLGPGPIAPFTVMPLRWELAFGGMSFLQNPLGRGIDPVPDDAGKPVPYLPCIEYPDSRIATPKDRATPAGFGPIAASWLPRSKQQGTRDQRWALFRAPLPPKDFDPGFYNAAPADQQLKKGYFNGDEAIVLTGFHPTHQRWTTALPGKRLRAFCVVDNADERKERPEAPEKKLVEVAMNLDTVHIDADKAEMVLLWRGQAPVKTPKFSEIEACYFAEEDVAAEPATLEEHEAKLKALQEPGLSAKAAARAAAEADPAAKERERLEAVKKDVRKVLVDSKVDPKVIAEIDEAGDAKSMFDIVQRATQDKIREVEAMTAAMKSG
jgi:hypothetical protein